MAALDIQGFITPEQQFTGLYKLGETLATQQAARQKAKAEQDANKKLLNQTIQNIDPKDFISGTIIDGKTTQDVYNLINKGYGIIKDNPNINQNELNSLLIQDTSKLAKRVQNAKEVKRQLDKGAEEMKGVAGFDVGKYYKLGNNYFLNPDGSVREDIENIDVSQDFYQKILENGDVWTSDAIHSILKEVPAVPETKTLDVRDAKGNRRKTMQELLYNPTFYKPKLRGTDFEGFEPESINALDENGEVIIDKKTKEPVPILGHNSYNFLMNKPQSMAYINQRKRQLAQQYNLDPNGVQVENLVRVELRDLVDTSPYKKASSKELKQDLAPVTNVYTGKGGKGDSETPFNPIYEKLNTIGNDLLSGNNKENKKYNFVPINKLPGDVRDAVRQSYANSIGKKLEKVGTDEFAINKLPNGEWGLFSAKNGRPVGNTVGTLSEDELNLGAAKGIKERKPILKDETKLPGYIDKSKTSQTKSKKDDPLKLFP